MSTVKRQFVINGMFTLTEGEYYRVKSGPFKGLALKLKSVRECHPDSVSTVSQIGTGARTPVSMTKQEGRTEFIPVAEMYLSGSNGVMEEEGYFSIMPLNLEPA